MVEHAFNKSSIGALVEGGVSAKDTLLSETSLKGGTKGTVIGM